MKITDNKNALAYFKNSVSSLKDDAKLLKSYLGISEFGYLKMFFDNRYFYLSSDPKMVDETIINQKDATIFYDKTSLVHNGYSVLLWPTVPTHYAMKFYQQHNHWNGITVLKKNEDSIEQFWFTSDINNNTAGHCYIRYHRLLIAFVQHWLENNRERLELDAPEQLATFVDGINFSNLDKIGLDLEYEQERLKKFLKHIQSGGVNINTKIGKVRITPRELECLSLLAKGNTGKEAANSLDISPRTIEGHINNIRSKLGFLCKSEIIKLYREQVISLE
jgi:DNA-binding CsgD family transcriptional regulator